MSTLKLFQRIFESGCAAFFSKILQLINNCFPSSPLAPQSPCNKCLRSEVYVPPSGINLSYLSAEAPAPKTTRSALMIDQNKKLWLHFSKCCSCCELCFGCWKSFEPDVMLRREKRAEVYMLSGTLCLKDLTDRLIYIFILGTLLCSSLPLILLYPFIKVLMSCRRS